mgnify:CR=1 FL=1
MPAHYVTTKCNANHAPNFAGPWFAFSDLLQMKSSKEGEPATGFGKNINKQTAGGGPVWRPAPAVLVFLIF